VLAPLLRGMDVPDGGDAEPGHEPSVPVPGSPHPLEG
jgi:hypothetical protein